MSWKFISKVLRTETLKNSDTQERQKAKSENVYGLDFHDDFIDHVFYSKNLYTHRHTYTHLNRVI